MLPRLEKLFISSSNLTALPDLNCLKKKLSSLRLLNSGIRHFPPCYFSRWRRLDHLDLTGNELTEIPAIERLSSTLLSLSLAKNNINTILGSWATEDYEKLMFIRLNHNNLTKFSFIHLASLHNEAEIQLTGNQISHLYQPITYGHNAYWIDLVGNPLVCDGKLAWVATSNFVISNGICSVPRCLQGFDVSRLSKYTCINIGVADQQ